MEMQNIALIYANKYVHLVFSSEIQILRRKGLVLMNLLQLRHGIERAFT